MEPKGEAKRPGDCPRCGQFISLAAFPSGQRLVCQSCGYLSLPLTQSGPQQASGAHRSS